jgi:uncharacterized protein (DUF885 family)
MNKEFKELQKENKKINKNINESLDAILKNNPNKPYWIETMNNLISELINNEIEQERFCGE